VVPNGTCLSSTTPAPGRRWRWRDLLLLTAVGVAAEAAVWYGYQPRLSFSDEIVYACIARNLAGGRGLVASHYVPASIVDGAYPSLYVHMPGHPLMVAPALLALGPTRAGVFAANWISFVAVGLILYELGSGLGSRYVGLLAALLYYACPRQLTLANTLMSEPTLALVTTLFLSLWLRAMAKPHWSSGAGLAAGLVAGMIHHETFLVLLPASLFMTLRVADGQRARSLAGFWVVFAVLIGLVFWPLHEARAFAAHHSASIFSQGLAATAAAMAASVWGNLVDLVSHQRGGASGTLATQLPYLALATLLGAWPWLRGSARWVLGFTASGFALMFLGLAPFYPVVRIGPRHVLLFVPAMCLLFAVLLERIRPLRVRGAVAVAAVAGLAFASQRDVAQLLRGRQARSYAHEAALSDTIRKYTAALQPRTALVEDAFLYAWDAWPVDVVFLGARMGPETFDLVNERLPIDVVALPGAAPAGPGEEAGPPALAPALLDRGYVLRGEEGGLWVYAARRLVPVRRPAP
jgi:hypothetical protein